jgi:choline dehydrogenase-like flavoprotein
MSVVKRIAAAVEASAEDITAAGSWGTGHHHYGGTRMGKSVADSVVNTFGEVHGVSNLFVGGGSIFVSQSANNPTLTMVALALRAAELVVRRAKE